MPTIHYNNSEVKKFCMDYPNFNWDPYLLLIANSINNNNVDVMDNKYELLQEKMDLTQRCISEILQTLIDDYNDLFSYIKNNELLVEIKEFIDTVKQ